MRNLELKVACDPIAFAHARSVAAALAAVTRLHQRDTYFVVRRGRLKLREIRHEEGRASAELIGYDRPDDASARWSIYHRATIAPEETPALLAALTGTLGLRIVVDKIPASSLPKPRLTRKKLNNTSKKLIPNPNNTACRSTNQAARGTLRIDCIDIR